MTQEACVQKYYSIRPALRVSFEFDMGFKKYKRKRIEKDSEI